MTSNEVFMVALFIVLALGLIVFMEVLTRRHKRRMADYYASKAICPDCGEFDDSSRLRAAMCPNQIHVQAARRRTAYLQGRDA